MSDTIASAKELAKILLANDIPTFIEGPPGVGKSALWAQIAEELNIGFIDLRLSQMDPVDLRGLPKNTTSKHGVDVTTWARPDFWPVVERDGERGIILFDELSDSGRAMQSAAYEIILDRRAGPHIIPPGWYPCAAGNRRSDKAAAQQISSALANRFAWIEVESNADCFHEYGIMKGIHHFILGFIKFRPALLHSMDGAEMRAFPTPRAWERISKIFTSYGDQKIPEGLMLKLVRANVGDGAAGEFCAFMRTMDLPDFDEIIADPAKCRIPSQPSAKYALSSMLARYAKRESFDKVIRYIKREEFGRDFEICVVLDATKRDASLTECKAFVDFANRNQDLKL